MERRTWLTPARRAAAGEYEAAIGELRRLNAEVLAAAGQLKPVTIEALLARFDLEVGIEALLRGRQRQRRIPGAGHREAAGLGQPRQLSLARGPVLLDSQPRVRGLGHLRGQAAIGHRQRLLRPRARPGADGADQHRRRVHRLPGIPPAASVAGEDVGNGAVHHRRRQLLPRDHRSSRAQHAQPPAGFLLQPGRGPALQPERGRRGPCHGRRVPVATASGGARRPASSAVSSLARTCSASG
jgi:hypothetical protein